MNYFIALRPTAAVAERLGQTVQHLHQWGLPARWVHPDDYHITVHFLGQLDNAEAAAMSWTIADVAQSWQPRALSLDGVGAFGGSTHPRVVYAAVGDPNGWLQDLHADVHVALDEPVPEWRPHITLCRPQPGVSSEGRTWPQLFEAFGQAQWGDCAIADMALMRSDPEAAGGGRRYVTVQAWT